MANNLDLNAELLNLNSGPKPSFLQITKTTDIQAPDAGQNLLRVFQDAFPDTEFTLSTVNGKPSISGIRKNAPPSVEKAVPEGFDPKLNIRGIQEMSKALESAPDDETKLHAATQLLAMVTTQKAFNFDKYKERAEIEYGVPDLLTAIDRVRQAEETSPFNPRTGMPSAQRLSLLETLGVARTRAANRVKELLDTDTNLIQAENSAKAVIMELEKGTNLANKRAIMEEREMRRIAKETAIGSMNPEFIQNVSILRNGKAADTDTERRAVAEGLYDGKIRLTEAERLLANATPDSLKAFYLVEKDQKKKEQALQLLQAKEELATGDPAQAKRNMDLFRKAYSIDVADLTATRDPKLSQRVKQKAQQNIAAYPDKRIRDEVNAQDKVAFQNEYLTNVINNGFQSDVSQWQGVIQSDDTAKSVLRSMKVSDPRNLNMRRFLLEYLSANDGKNMAEKSRSIQAIVASALGAFPRSVVLPIPSEESLALQTQAMMASAYTQLQFRAINPFSGSSYPGAYGDLLKKGTIEPPR